MQNERKRGAESGPDNGDVDADGGAVPGPVSKEMRREEPGPGPGNANGVLSPPGLRPEIPSPGVNCHAALEDDVDDEFADLYGASPGSPGPAGDRGWDGTGTGDGSDPESGDGPRARDRQGAVTEAAETNIPPRVRASSSLSFSDFDSPGP